MNVLLNNKLFNVFYMFSPGGGLNCLCNRDKSTVCENKSLGFFCKSAVILFLKSFFHLALFCVRFLISFHTIPKNKFRSIIYILIYNYGYLSLKAAVHNVLSLFINIVLCGQSVYTFRFLKNNVSGEKNG